MDKMSHCITFEISVFIFRLYASDEFHMYSRFNKFIIGILLSLEITSQLGQIQGFSFVFHSMDHILIQCLVYISSSHFLVVKHPCGVDSYYIHGKVKLGNYFMQF